MKQILRTKTTYEYYQFIEHLKKSRAKNPEEDFKEDEEGTPFSLRK